VDNDCNQYIFELLPNIKYRFNESGLKPFVLLAIGVNIYWIDGSVEISNELSFAPQAGAGMEFDLENNLYLFIQAKYAVVFPNGNRIMHAVSSYVPVQAGLGFNL